MKKGKRLLAMAFISTFVFTSLIASSIFAQAQSVTWAAASGTPTITTNGDANTIVVADNAAKAVLAPTTELSFKMTLTDMAADKWSFLRFNSTEMTGGFNGDHTGVAIQPLGGGICAYAIDGTDNANDPRKDFTMNLGVTYLISLKLVNNAVVVYVDGVQMQSCTNAAALAAFDGTHNIYVWCGGGGGTYTLEFLDKSTTTYDYGQWHKADDTSTGSNCTIKQDGDSTSLTFDGVSHAAAKDVATVKLHPSTAVNFSIEQDEYIPSGSWHMIRIGKQTHTNAVAEMDAVEFYFQYESTADNVTPAVKVRNAFTSGTGGEIRTPNYLGYANYYSLKVENGTANVYSNGKVVYSSTAPELLDILNGTDDIYFTMSGEGIASYNFKLNATMPAGYDPSKASEPTTPNYDSIVITSNNESAVTVDGTVITLKKAMTDTELTAALKVPDGYQAYIVDSTGSAVTSGTTVTSDCKVAFYDTGVLIRTYSIVAPNSGATTAAATTAVAKTTVKSSSPSTGDSIPYVAMFGTLLLLTTTVLLKKKKESR